MNPRDHLLETVKQGLAEHLISRDDLSDLLARPQSDGMEVPQIHAVEPVDEHEIGQQDKHALGIVDILFDLAGIILFAALMTFSFQVGSDSSMHALIVLIPSLLFWSAAFFVGKQPAQNDTKQGLVHAMLLTGCLSLISGGFLLAYQVFGQVDGGGLALIFAALLVMLSAAHVAFDRLLPNLILIVFSVFLFVAAFPTALGGLIASSNPSADIWGLISIATGVLLAVAGRLASKSAIGREHLKDMFESLAGFIIVASIYGLGFAPTTGVFWQLVLPLAIYAAFFVSIKRRSKQFLVTGSLFLVIFLITISFRYFSGAGAAFCLILSAFSILATAFVAIGINKKYIKQVTQ